MVGYHDEVGQKPADKPDLSHDSLTHAKLRRTFLQGSALQPESQANGHSGGASVTDSGGSLWGSRCSMSLLPQSSLRPSHPLYLFPARRKVVVDSVEANVKCITVVQRHVRQAVRAGNKVTKLRLNHAERLTRPQSGPIPKPPESDRLALGQSVHFPDVLGSAYSWNAWYVNTGLLVRSSSELSYQLAKHAHCNFSGIAIGR
ncbi:hypothetical protein EDD22DRAFT_991420 [Suillus occidentalis]|nr:hypothetical protein EDD22DRAFT_991420 [Suillus occidentalis]